MTLTATAAPGSVFTGFTGCTASAANPSQCTAVVSGTTLVKANFALLMPLTVTLAGSGSGTVVSAPPGINCGAPGGACSASVASGVAIQLTASPATGSMLSGFTGCGSVSGNVCTVTVGSATAVTASFEAADVGAVVTGWKTKKVGQARTTRVTIEADQAVNVVVKITRNGAVIASRTVNDFQPGTRSVSVSIPRAVKGGKASLRVVLTNAGGASKTQTGTVKIPAKG